MHTFTISLSDFEDMYNLILKDFIVPKYIYNEKEVKIKVCG